MSTEPIRVLVIEDDDVDYRQIQRCLKNRSRCFQTACATSLEEGLAELDSARYDVVVTDLTLPDSEGLAVVKTIQSHHSGLPIVVLTGLDDNSVEVQALDEGAQDYLVKREVTPHTLDRAIHHAIQRRRLLNEIKARGRVVAEQRELLRRKNRRLKKLYRTAHRFVDNVSHEFRTPLTVIKDYVTIIRDGLVGDVNDEQRRLLDITSVRAEDLNNMVDDMLDVSKLQSGLMGLWRRECHLTEVVQQVRPALDKKAEVKGIEFEIDVSEELPDVYCDPEKVSRIVINLVVNAVKFCGNGGKVRLWAKPQSSGREVLIGVTDDGPGMDEEDLQSIFERFKQLKGGAHQATKGFGLGLNIVKELVDLSFGELNVESELGEGSTFTFTLPTAEPAEVVSRYLKHVSSTQKMITASLVRATVDPDASLQDANDMEPFFNYLLRRNDLLFRVDSHSWMFVTAVPPLEIERFLQRAQEEWKKTNRNRPFGPLPSFEMSLLGTWEAKTEKSEILGSFRAEFSPAGVLV